MGTLRLRRRAGGIPGARCRTVAGTCANARAGSHASSGSDTNPDSSAGAHTQANSGSRANADTDACSIAEANAGANTNTDADTCAGTSA